VLLDYLRKRDDAHDHVGGAFQYFVAALRRGHGLLHGRCSQIHGNRLAISVPTLKATRELIDEMLAQVKENQRRGDEDA